METFFSCVFLIIKIFDRHIKQKHRLNIVYDYFFSFEICVKTWLMLSTVNPIFY